MDFEGIGSLVQMCRHSLVSQKAYRNYMGNIIRKYFDIKILPEARKW